MIETQTLLSGDEMKSVLVHNFDCNQMIQTCRFPRTIKAHLMMLKAKDTLPLFLAVEYVKSVGNLSRGMFHYHPKHESEVVELLNCGEFWVRLGIMKPYTTRV